VTRDQAHVLEIRVHGVRGTRPWESLGFDNKNDVQPCTPSPPGMGTDSVDGRTGFYCAKKTDHDMGGATAGADPRLNGGPRLHVEAYSWGGLTSSPGGGLKPSFWLALENLVRSFWLLLAPFAFVNVAMWSRPGLSMAGHRGFASAVMIRWAGLLLTCLLLVTVCGISFDLVAWQCFRHGRSYCTNIDFLSSVFGRQRAVERIALAAAIPLTALLVLVMLSWQTIRKTEARQFSQIPAPGPSSEPTHVLRRIAFWEGMARTNALLLLHLASGMCVIAVSMSAPVHALEQPGSWLLPLPLSPTLLVLLANFVCLAVGVQDQIEHGPSTRLQRTRQVGPKVLAGLSVAALAANVLWLWNGHGSLDQSGQLPLTSDVQIFITACLFALVYVLAAVLSAVWFAWVAGTILAVFTAMLILDPTAVRENFSWVVALLTAAYLTGALVHYRTRNGATVRGWAWYGLAPAHLLGFGVFVGVMYSTVATLWSAAFLDGRLNPALLTQSIPYTATADISGQNLIVPSPFLWFAMFFLPGLGAALILAASLVLRFRRRGKEALEKLAVMDDLAGEGYALDKYELHQRIDTIQKTRPFRSRYFAAIIHRGEALLGAIALIPLSLGFGAAAGMLSTLAPPLPPLVAAGVVTASLTGIILGLLVIVSIFREDSLRTIGIIWDLSTFWPRTAHPFSPPCYGERVVPELVDRVRAGLTEPRPTPKKWGIAPCQGSDPLAAAARYDYVILSGHSLGSAILAAVMLQLTDEEIRRIRFVSYGSQLRAWFGRFFPDLLGPKVLGHEVTVRPDFGSADPDAPQQARKKGFTPPAGSLASLLQTDEHWRSLYRRTDPLGFPVFQDTENDIDHYLSEWDPPAAQGTRPGREIEPLNGHSRYQESAPYRRVIDGWLKAGEKGV
jgi:hypothetical protein